MKIENLSNHLGSCGSIVNVEDTSNILNCSEIYFQKTNSHSKFYYFIISWKLKQRKTYSIFKKQTQTLAASTDAHLPNIGRNGHITLFDGQLMFRKVDSVLGAIVTGERGIQDRWGPVLA